MRQPAKTQRGDDEPRNDLVADPEMQPGIESVVAERDRRSERDDIAGKQRQLHPVLALRDAVAHGRHAARDLRGGAHFARGGADDFGEMLKRRMGREHVVIGGDDTDIRPGIAEQLHLVDHRAAGAGMGLVALGQTLAGILLRLARTDHFQIGRAGVD